jgi:hypothetical protein
VTPSSGLWAGLPTFTLAARLIDRQSAEGGFLQSTQAFTNPVDRVQTVSQQTSFAVLALEALDETDFFDEITAGLDALVNTFQEPSGRINYYHPLVDLSTVEDPNPFVYRIGYLPASVQAQTCTTENWDEEVNLSNADAGVQDSDNRRYGGPCGLRVQAGLDRYLRDLSPVGEPSYIVRFYAFLDQLQGQGRIFAAGDGTDNHIEVWSNVPSSGDLTLRVFSALGIATDLTINDPGTGWHSVELVWASDPSATIFFKVDDQEQSASLDSNGLVINEARLGLLNGSGLSGSVDFDNFDSRRISRPGRLMLGDANDDWDINSLDFIIIIREILGDTFASGQPDCNEDGVINSLDFICVINLITGSSSQQPMGFPIFDAIFADRFESLPPRQQ